MTHIILLVFICIDLVLLSGCCDARATNEFDIHHVVQTKKIREDLGERLPAGEIKVLMFRILIGYSEETYESEKAGLPPNFPRVYQAIISVMTHGGDYVLANIFYTPDSIDERGTKWCLPYRTHSYLLSNENVGKGISEKILESFLIRSEWYGYIDKNIWIFYQWESDEAAELLRPSRLRIMNGTGTYKDSTTKELMELIRRDHFIRGK
ncbi:hypothetical protein LBMAG53_17020 [Planctomycetota bacterium]|nr:hypothetical protein LBMAG53_17020 [Planctomycetota bacterium]